MDGQRALTQRQGLRVLTQSGVDIRQKAGRLRNLQAVGAVCLLSQRECLLTRFARRCVVAFGQKGPRALQKFRQSTPC
jgi:hypothetical protein